MVKGVWKSLDFLMVWLCRFLQWLTDKVYYVHWKIEQRAHAGEYPF